MNELDEALQMAEHLEKVTNQDERRPMMQHMITLAHEVKRLREERDR